MGVKDLQAFIEAKKKTMQSTEIDWNKIKNDWLGKLDQLYSEIEKWLNDVGKDSVSINYLEKEINEENIGLYRARKMILKIANEQISLDPVGTLLIGAAGRVDMTGKNGNVKLVLVPGSTTGVQIKVQIKGGGESEEDNGKEEMVWKIATPPPSIKYIELDFDSFSDALLEVIGE